MKKMKRIWSGIIAVVMLVTLMPTQVFAWENEIYCDWCGSFCGDDYICSGGDHCSEESGRDCYSEHHCQVCSECADNASEWCEDCKMCVDCAMENECHCKECGVCGVDELICEECGRCYVCGGECTEGESHVCLECHFDNNMACSGCGLCYVDDETLRCNICGLCSECASDWCEDCKMCLECAVDNNCHCADCGKCQVEQELCTNCWRCYECGEECTEGESHVCLECHFDDNMACSGCGLCYVDDETVRCIICGYCAECEGEWCQDCYMGVECAMDNGTHCPDCGVCIVDAKLCENCWRCYECGGECSEGDDHDCLECHVADGMACPECGLCHMEDDSSACPECGICVACADEWCDNCGMCAECGKNEELHCTDCGVCLDEADAYCDGCFICSDCSEGVCLNCNACSNCVDICSSCGEYCESCALLCADCGACDSCADIYYCDICGDYYCGDCREACENCETCSIHVDFCNECGMYCPECSSLCENCGACDNCVVLCENCGRYCSDCYETCPDCDVAINKKISAVALTSITVPKENNTPDYTVTATDYNMYNVMGSSYEPVTWYEDGNIMESTDTFETGHNYSVSVMIYAMTGYEFSVNKNATPYESLVTGTLDGKRASVRKAYEQDPWQVVEVYYDFGMINDTVIENVYVANLDKPVAGHTPDYFVDSYGTGYSVPDRSYEEKQHGVMWYDATTETYLYPDTKFIAGHQYTVYITLETDSYDYEFYTDNDGEIMTKGYLDDVWVTLTFRTNPKYDLVMQHTFTCEKEKVSGVQITNLAIPKHGKGADYTLDIDTAGCVLDTGYGFGGIYWYKPDNSIMTSDDTFVGGCTYQAEIKLIPETVDGSVVSEFITPFSAIVNGTTLPTDDVFASSKSVYLYYTVTAEKEKVSAINITDLIAPEHGNALEYELKLDNSAVEVDNIYWYNPDETIMTDGDTFIGGEEYKIEIKLTSALVEEMKISEFTTPFTATINGKTVAAEDVYVSSDEVYLYYTFACPKDAAEKEKISSINITGLTEPANGGTPDYTVTLDNTACILDTSYGNGGVCWYKSDGTVMGVSEAFVGGSEYRVEVKLIPAMLDDEAVSKFVTPFTATINGKQVNMEGSYISANRAYLTYTFTCSQEDAPVETKVIADVASVQDKCIVNVTMSEEDRNTASQLYIAFYDNGGALINVTIYDVEIQSDSAVIYEVDIPEGAVKCKTMLWDEELIPLCESQTASI